LRLVVFGGSAGFCYHQTDAETWPGKLQFYLRQGLNMPVEVINLALPGFDSSNSKINYLFTARELHPHVSLLYHTVNDLKFFRPMEKNPIAVIFAWIAGKKPYWQHLARKTQIGRRVRNFLLARKNNIPYGETQYTSLNKEGAGAARPVVPEALQWARKNFSDFVMFSRSDKVLPVMVSQATIVAKQYLTNPKYNTRLSMDLVGMTWPVLLDTWQEMNRIIKEVCDKDLAIFVDGYNAVPHNYNYLEDHAHLTTEGCDVLARAISDTLLKDERFLKVAKHLREKP